MVPKFQNGFPMGTKIMTKNRAFIDTMYCNTVASKANKVSMRNGTIVRFVPGVKFGSRLIPCQSLGLSSTQGLF